MTILELLFLAFVLASLITAVAAFIRLARGGRRSASRLFTILGVTWFIYMLVVVLVSAFAPQRLVPRNEELCYDEMCFAVVDVRTVVEPSPADHESFYVVDIRVSNHARGRTESEAGLRPRVWDGSRYYDVSVSGQQAWNANHRNPPLTTRLAPGENVVSTQVFELPRTTSPLYLLLDHGFTPGYFVIEESPLIRQPKLLQLQP
jgi:hypothetical protein